LRGEEEEQEKPNGIPDQLSFVSLRDPKRKLSGMTRVGLSGMTQLGLAMMMRHILH
jgi:hypothetical protein